MRIFYLYKCKISHHPQKDWFESVIPCMYMHAQSKENKCTLLKRNLHTGTYFTLNSFPFSRNYGWQIK